ncbi:MAG: proline dehydrogenase family protein [Cyclobacteriaceae bacterium]
MSYFSDLSVFDTKSTKQLRFTYFMYRLISNPWVNSVGENVIDLFQKLHLPLPTFILKPTIFKQFCGGESVVECKQSIQELAFANVATFLDYSVEGNQGEKSRLAVFNELKRAIVFASQQKEVPIVVFKATGLIEKKALEKPLNNQTYLIKGEKLIHELCLLANHHKVMLMLDAEETWLQDQIDTIALRMMGEFNKEKVVLYTTYQLYRKDGLKQLQNHHKKIKNLDSIFAVKLVRGAYLDKERKRAIAQKYPDPLNPTKQATDQLYDDTLKYCVDHLETISICCASHSEPSNELLTRLMKDKEIQPNDPRIYFTQLYGMSDHISYKLGKEGFNVAKYLPYGKVKEVIPYLIRRAKENQSVQGQLGREVQMMKEVLESRKTS